MIPHRVVLLPGQNCIGFRNWKQTAADLSLVSLKTLAAKTGLDAEQNNSVASRNKTIM